MSQFTTLDGEVLTANGIVNITEIENDFEYCDTERQMLHVLAAYLCGSTSTIDDVKSIIDRRVEEMYK